MNHYTRRIVYPLAPKNFLVPNPKDHSFFTLDRVLVHLDHRVFVLGSVKVFGDFIRVGKTPVLFTRPLLILVRVC